MCCSSRACNEQAVETAQPTEAIEAVEEAETTTEAEEPTEPEEVATEEPTAIPEPVAELKVLRIANTANITTWDPVKSFSTEAAYMGNMYEQLLRINPPGAEERFTPLLAESWESSADGLVWTFYLRPDVFFHDGEPLTAEAVKLSIEAAAARGGASFIWLPLDTITVVDDLTVQFNLKWSAPLDLIASSLYGAWIISPQALAAADADENYFEAGLESWHRSVHARILHPRSRAAVHPL